MAEFDSLLTQLVHADCLHIFNESNKEILINGTIICISTGTAGLANVVQMYKTAIDRFLAHLTATSCWDDCDRPVSYRSSLGHSGFVQYTACLT
jgi:hypothetical protein